MAKIKITQLVEGLLEDFLRDNSYELYFCEFVKEGKDWFLRVYIDFIGDSDRYIGVEDCEKVSRYLSERLDESDPIEQNYYLEVSSPGMDRSLITESHYNRYEGSDVEVRLYKAVDGTKTLKGVLGKLDGEIFTLTEENGKIHQIRLKDVARTRLAVLF